MSELFLKVIHRSISAGCLVFVVLLLRFVLKKAPRWVNILLWGLVAVRLLCPFTVESPFSMIPDPIGSGEMISEWMDHYAGGVDGDHPSSVYYGAAAGAGREPVADSSGGSYAVTQQNQLGEPDTAENIVMPILSAVWASGMALLLLYAAVSYVRLQRRVATAVRYRSSIYQSENVSSPFVLGIIRPKIYLPFQMDSQDLEHVIAHEQAHICRKDHWWKPLGFLLLAVHWFNPLMWLAYVLLCRDIELACDEKVIRSLSGEQRAGYTQVLVSCSVSRPLISACPLAFGEVGVKQRVESILNYRKPAFWVIIMAVILCGTAAVCFLTDPMAGKEPLAWAQDLRAEEVLSADLVVLPQSPGKQFKRLAGGEIAQMTELINGSRGTWQPEPEAINGQSIFFYITTVDGTTHSVGNIGNTYLSIDGACYEADCGWLASWSAAFGAGDSQLPAQYFLKQLTLDDVRALSAKGDELTWADLADFQYLDVGSGLYVRVYRINDTLLLMAGGDSVEPEETPLYVRLALRGKTSTYVDLREGDVESFLDRYGGGEARETGQLVPGTAYVSCQCLYMTPLSSVAGLSGDSGCRYIVGERSFTWEDRRSGQQETVEVPQWAWQAFPYTDQEWAEMYFCGSEDPLPPINQTYEERLYQPLDPDNFLLKLDGALWLVQLGRDPRGAPYLWSIYRLVPEAAMGVAQWEYAPEAVGRRPGFRFCFDLECEFLTASCTKGELLDPTAPGMSDAAAGDRGRELIWSPVEENGELAGDAVLAFSATCEGKTMAGRLYLKSSGSGGRRIYTASLGGTGMRLEPGQAGGGVITAATPEQLRPVGYDLTEGELTLPAELLEQVVFYTNSTEISVVVQGLASAGTVELLDISQDNAQVQQAKVAANRADCRFTGLTSARLYRIACGGLTGCTVTVSG